MLGVEQRLLNVLAQFRYAELLADLLAHLGDIDHLDLCLVELVFVCRWEVNAGFYLRPLYLRAFGMMDESVWMKMKIR